MIVVGGCIYYHNNSDSGSLYRVKTDETRRERISTQPVNFVNIAGNLMLYKNPQIEQMEYLEIS
ncbi:MAG: DUF5050 domain-containing protein [Ruthenibacterium sp.]